MTEIVDMIRDVLVIAARLRSIYQALRSWMQSRHQLDESAWGPCAIVVEDCDIASQPAPNGVARRHKGSQLVRR